MRSPQRQAPSAAVADRLLITKADLADPQILKTLQQRLSRLNPGALMQSVSQGKIDPAQLFGAALNPHARSAELARWLPEAAIAHSSSDHAQHYDDHIRAYCTYLDEPISAMGMAAWLTALTSLRGANLLRVKALLNVEGRPVAVHAVQTLIHEPISLAQWPDDDRRSRLVFISRDMARAEIEATLDILRLKPASPSDRPQQIDPRAYAQFAAAMKKVH